MVDLGSGQNQSVIDLTTRRRRQAGAWSPSNAGGLLESSEKLLSIPFLLDGLSSESQQVSMWAAYQLVDRHQEECEQFIDRLWESPHEEIRESAITLIGKFRLTDYAFPMMRVFNSKDHPHRYIAGVALGRLAYEPVGRALERWFAAAVSDPETPTQALECATESLLHYEVGNYRDVENHWDVVFRELAPCDQNHAFYSILFGQLCLHAKTPGQIGKLAMAYSKVRDVFNDIHLTEHLVELAGRSNLIRFFQTRLNGGYPLDAVYRDSLKVVCREPADEETAQLVAAMAGISNRSEALRRFPPLAEKLLERLGNGTKNATKNSAESYGAALGVLKACGSWLENWEQAMLKVRELEFHLIISLPLAALLKEAEADCLADPEGEALRITRLYQSPLLSPAFMVEVLKLIGHGKHRTGMAEMVGVPYAGWVRDEEKDALWRLFSGQLKTVDYPLEQVLPQPWLYPVPGLMKRLVEHLVERIDGYIESGRGQAVEFCLEVFRRAGDETVAEKLLPHFETLINHHYHGFVEMMTHLPDACFLQPLVNHYQIGEADLLRLIRFICNVHNRPHPDLEEEAPPDANARTSLGTVRLLCRSCGGGYEYKPGSVFVDEERIEQRQIPTARDVWTPTRFECKKCGAPVPFDPDSRFLNDLFAELLATRLFPPGGGEEDDMENIHLIQFPAFQGKTLNPAHFLKEMERLMESPTDPEGMNPHLLELGRFQMEIGEVEEAKQSLQKIIAGPGKSPLAIYYLGILAFKEKNLYEARVYFSRLISSCTREDFQEELDNPVDMAHHYLKLLDKREFKRSQFRLISS